jgi:hypothetical protein
MAPSAPALFSTTSAWPIDCDTDCASTRVIVSVAEPAGNGTTTRIGFAGYCPHTGSESAHTSAPSTIFRMASPLRLRPADIKP